MDGIELYRLHSAFVPRVVNGTRSTRIYCSKSRSAFDEGDFFSKTLEFAAKFIERPLFVVLRFLTLASHEYVIHNDDKRRNESARKEERTVCGESRKRGNGKRFDDTGEGKVYRITRGVSKEARGYVGKGKESGCELCMVEKKDAKTNRETTMNKVNELLIRKKEG